MTRNNLHYSWQARMLNSLFRGMRVCTRQKNEILEVSLHPTAAAVSHQLSPVSDAHPHFTTTSLSPSTPYNTSTHTIVQRPTAFGGRLRTSVAPTHVSGIKVNCPWRFVVSCWRAGFMAVDLQTWCRCLLFVVAATPSAAIICALAMIRRTL